MGYEGCRSHVKLESRNNSDNTNGVPVLPVAGSAMTQK
jgi:hypothetical protein